MFEERAAQLAIAAKNRQKLLDLLAKINAQNKEIEKKNEGLEKEVFEFDRRVTHAAD